MELLDRVGLAEQGDEYPDRLSGGQQQRVAIVRALAIRPGCCCSTRSPRPWTRSWSARCSASIRDLKDEGMTMVIATHEMGFARQVADRCASWTAGWCWSAAPPAEVFGAPREERTRQFLSRLAS